MILIDIHYQFAPKKNKPLCPFDEIHYQLVSISNLTKYSAYVNMYSIKIY